MVCRLSLPFEIASGDAGPPAGKADNGPDLAGGRETGEERRRFGGMMTD